MTPYPPNRNGQTPNQGQKQGPAISFGADMFNTGGGLLSTPVAGNGVGQVQMPQGPAMPNSRVVRNSFGAGRGLPTLNTDVGTNPWLRQQGRGIRNETNEMLGQNLLGIQGQSVASGGLGGSRQGVAQGTALGQAANYMSSNLADMYGSAYENDANRNMQKYGIDSNSFVGQRGQDITMRGQDFQNYSQGQDRGLQQYQGDQNFWTGQRGQDLATVGMGSGLITQGLNTQWLPQQNAADVYAKFEGNGTTTNTSSSGGGWMGALGGAAGIYQMGNAGGWW